MTTYNRAHFIREAIESVLQQTYQNWELLILDDASTDDTEHVIDSFVTGDSRIQYLPTPQNLGITKNRNRGLREAHGEYIAILDSDDVWCDATKLERQVSYLESHPDALLVGTQVKVIDENGAQVGALAYKIADADIRKTILLRNEFAHSSIVFRMCPGVHYDETVPIWEDYELILNLGTRGALANLTETMTAYRKHSGNISKEDALRGGRTHLAIVHKYKDSYPNYYPAVVKGYLRILKAYF